MKTIGRQDVSWWNIIKPEKCEICGEKAEYVLRAVSILRGVRTAELCEKHRQEWINGLLTL
jgi:hypothetical protein